MFCPPHELLGEALTTFELGGGFGRTKDAETASLELVHNTKIERDLRADDGQLHSKLLRQSNQSRNVLRVTRKAGGFRPAMPPFPGVQMTSVTSRRLAQLPHHPCVLATAPADDQRLSWRYEYKGTALGYSRRVLVTRSKLKHRRTLE